MQSCVPNCLASLGGRRGARARTISSPYFFHLLIHFQDFNFITQPCPAANHFRIFLRRGAGLLRVPVTKQHVARRETSLDEDFEDEGDILPKDVTDWAPNPEQLCWALTFCPFVLTFCFEIFRNTPAITGLFVRPPGFPDFPF